ncbi:MAG: type II toxin-antitoxin system HicA family toxin [Planctomycetota bacterium]|nr:type II toxin-antitoxin system HicA family toxin [Planctomycetota bacterium]
MSKRARLLFRMRAAPHDIRFRDIDTLLRQEGFVIFNQRGSHCTYHRADGIVITIVKPHGGRRTCHPCDVKRLLEVLGYA